MLHRFAATLFAGIFALQLSLAGGDASWLMVEHGAMDSQEVASAAMNAMPGMTAGQPAEADRNAVPPAEEPCDSSTSHTPCRTAAPCNTGYVVPCAGVESLPAAASGSPPVELVSMPISHFTAPELPRPRG